MSLKINDKDNKVYIIIGAPKSATSLIANGLIKQGIYLGEDADKKRSHECSDAVALNAEIIDASGGKMVRPLEEKEILKLNFSQKIIAYIKKHKRKMWGFKDPRTSLTGKLWLPHLDGDVYLFCCFRKPRKVKKSYRGVFPISEINKYNESIISIIRQFCELDK